MVTAYFENSMCYLVEKVVSYTKLHTIVDFCIIFTRFILVQVETCFIDTKLIHRMVL
jgi:hypothetical protein